MAILVTAIVLSKNSDKLDHDSANSSVTSIFFNNVIDESGIDFEHYGERHRWCEIGPQVQGLATNEEILVSLFDNPFEFANRHLIRMNGSGAAWLDYDNTRDWDLYLPTACKCYAMSSGCNPKSICCALGLLVGSSS